MYIFTVEYLARVALVGSVPVRAWSSTLDQPRTKRSAVWLYAKQPMNIIDFVAIIPFWIKMTGATKSSFGVLRIIRLTRVLRMARSPAVAASVAVFARAIKV